MGPLRFHRARFCCAFVLSWLIVANVASVQAGGASITLQPVPPKTVPPSNYPPGTTIVGSEIVLGSVPARVWLEVHVTGWPNPNTPPYCPKSVLATIDATDFTMDGGGYAGSAADCLGVSGNGGDLVPAVQACTNATDCRNAISGRVGPCFAGEPSKCIAGYCCNGFQDHCNPEYIGQGVIVTDGGGPCEAFVQSINYRFGETVNPGDCMIDFAPSYLGTLVLDVPEDAKGTYTIDFAEAASFLQNQGNPPNNNIPISFFPARITVPCGRCCSGYATESLQCLDHITVFECLDSVDQIFTVDELCPENGGSACSECASHADCDDGIACTIDQCHFDHTCLHTPTNAICDDGLFCNGQEICDPSTGCIDGSIPCDPNLCDENTDACRAGIPTISNWGLVILILAVLVAAKLRFPSHESN